MKDLDEKLTVEIGDERFDFSTRDTLGIDRDNLDEELARQAVLYGWFLIRREHARAIALGLEDQIKDYEAGLDPKIRAAAKEEGVKITEAQIKAAMRLDQKNMKLKIELRHAIKNEGLLGAFVDAFRHRKDMLVSLGFARRQEMGTPTTEEIGRIKRNLGHDS